MACNYHALIYLKKFKQSKGDRHTHVPKLSYHEKRSLRTCFVDLGIYTQTIIFLRSGIHRRKASKQAPVHLDKSLPYSNVKRRGRFRERNTRHLSAENINVEIS